MGKKGGRVTEEWCPASHLISLLALLIAPPPDTPARRGPLVRVCTPAPTALYATPNEPYGHGAVMGRGSVEAMDGGWKLWTTRR